MVPWNVALLFVAAELEPCIAANKVARVRGCLITGKFSAQQGVEDDNMNMICLGCRMITESLGRGTAKYFPESKIQRRGKTQSPAGKSVGY